MGILTYGGCCRRVQIEDSLLAVVRIITVTRLRRNQPFVLSAGSPSSPALNLWMHPGIELIFDFDTFDVPAPEMSILRRVMACVDRSGRLRISDFVDASDVRHPVEPPPGV